MNNASRSFAKKTLEELKSKMLGDIEMTPGKWVAAAVVASASLIAIGYLAGSSSNHEEVSLNKIQETREKMLQQGNPQNTQKDVHATVDSEEDEDERWNAFGQQQDSSELSEEGRQSLN